jgi:agmatine deiminase
MDTSPFFQPAEWAPHSSCWLAWPSHGDLWKEELVPAQAEFTALCRAICDVDAQGKARGESLNILVPTDAAQKDAAKALAGLPVTFHSIPFGDIWLRDTAPLFLINPQGELATVRFQFNGWGGKYSLPFDDQVSKRIEEKSSTATAHRHFSFPWILEGGSIEVDGEGTCLTSEQCLLNPNRNPNMGKAEIEAALSKAIGVRKTIWVKDGLLNDHTDGHIDTIARYVAPGVVACMKAVDPESDPNHAVMEQIARDLESFTDAQGRRLKVERISSPGKICDEDGRIMPASYLNFYIGNSTVVVPVYGSENDDRAVAEIAKLFPTRKTVGLSARAILAGGGAFHCITQQQPKSATP